jgi:replicative DNA helicase
MAPATRSQSSGASQVASVGDVFANAAAEPPKSLEAEVSVLGSMLLNNETIDVVIPLLNADSFFSSAHAKIYEAVLVLHDNQRAVDIITLRDELDRAKTLEAVGGVEYVSTLVDSVPAASNVEHYAEIVREKAITRSLLGAARKIFDAASQGGEHSRELLDMAQAEIFRIAEEGAKGTMAPMKEVIDAVFHKIDLMTNQQGVLGGLATGFHDLDEKTNGLQPGELIIVAARPSMGKTTLALNIIRHVGVVLDKPALIFSLEMSREQLAQNMLCSHARLDSDSLRRGRLRDDELAKLPMLAASLSEAPIYIDDQPGLNSFELRSKVRRLKAQKGCSLVVIDYMQLLHGPKSESRQAEIGSISRSLKSLAREMKVPVIAIAQLNRQVESRDDKRPRMSDLRESGSIEQDADVIILLNRPAYYATTEEERDDGRTELIIAKQRNGPTGMVNLTFIKEQLRFESYSGELEPPL